VLRPSSTAVGAFRDTRPPRGRWFLVTIITGLVAVTVFASVTVLSRTKRRRQWAGSAVEMVSESEITTPADRPDNFAPAVQRQRRYPELSRLEADDQRNRRERFVRSIVESGPKESWSTDAQSAIATALLSLPADIQSRIAQGQLRCAAAACIVDVATSDVVAERALEELFLQRSADGLHAWQGWIQYESARDGARTTTTFALMKPEDRQNTLEKGRQIHGK
jgi:hypothetical protein